MNNSLLHPDFIDQIPGGILVLDTNSIFLTGNHEALTLLGFTSNKECEGKTYYQMPCKASEEHENFIALDQKALKKPLQVLGFACYKDDNWRVLHGEKYPIVNEKGEVCFHVTHTKDITKLAALYHYANFIDIYHKRQQAYIIEESFPEDNLSDREHEVLYFFLRGDTAKGIGRKLNISHRTIEGHLLRIKEKL